MAGGCAPGGDALRKTVENATNDGRLGNLASRVTKKKETATDDRSVTILDSVYDENSTSTVEDSENDESIEKNQSDSGPDGTSVALDSYVARRHRRGATQSNSSKKSSEAPETRAPTTRRRRRRARLRVRIVRRRLPVHRTHDAETRRNGERAGRTNVLMAGAPCELRKRKHSSSRLAQIQDGKKKSTGRTAK